MPMYEYLCAACGHQDDEFFKMSTSSDPRTCPKCDMKGVYVRQVSLPHTDLKEFHTPIEMYSIAMNTREEIEEFLRAAPGVDCSLDEADPMYGIPIARSRSQKKHALKAAGYVEKN